MIMATIVNTETRERGTQPAPIQYSNDAEMTNRLTALMDGDEALNDAADDTTRDDDPKHDAPDDELSAADADADIDDDNDEVPDDDKDDVANDGKGDDKGDDTGAPNEISFEYEGKNYVVPKPLIEGAMRQERYQEVMAETASHREYLVEQTNVIAAEMQRVQQVEPLLAEARAIDTQLVQMRDALHTLVGDPDAYNNLRQTIVATEQARAQLATTAQTKNAEIQTARNAARARLIESGDRVLAQAIPNWGKPVYNAIMKHAQGVGFAPAELAEMLDPRIIKLLHSDMQRATSKGATAGDGKSRASSGSGTPKTGARVAKPAAPVVKPSAGAATGANPARQNIEALKTRARKTGSSSDAERAMLALMNGAGR